MPAIRFPASAVPLLQLCKGHGESYIFRTYADMIGFLAAYGYKLCEDLKWRAEPAPEFSGAINPIDLVIFQNRELLANFIMVQIAQGNSVECAADEGLICRKIESYSSLGAEHILTLIKSGNSSDKREIISNLILLTEHGEASI